jgi:diaminohydroxyphosphoribosylaminopyrimidine deaminase/5-amino-6-(5-phosphoribosylamino)uracil reductase
MRAMSDARFLRLALRLAQRGYGRTSPNPMVGAVLVKRGGIIGRGWHRRAGGPHAEMEALQDAARRGLSPRGATLYVTLEPCSTHGRTPPCTRAIIAAGIRRVVIGTIDPNPRHAGRGLQILRRSGVRVELSGGPRLRGKAGAPLPDRLKAELQTLNEAFDHWIVHRTPFVLVKAALTLDGRIATASGESKWITGPKARARGMQLRRGADAILVGINTILADDPALTVRSASKTNIPHRMPRRIVLDAKARTPLHAKVVSDASAASTTIVVSAGAPRSRVEGLRKQVRVLVAPLVGSTIKNQKSQISLPWLLKRLGREAVTALLVEGGGEVNASFLLNRLAHRVAFFYAPKILGGRDSRPAVAGAGAGAWREILDLTGIEWRRVGPDLMLTARVAGH